MSKTQEQAVGLGADTAEGLSRTLTTVFAVACGAMVANIYYAQSLIGLIAPELGLHDSLAGFIVTLTQLGYGAGLLFVVCLADLVENRRLILTTTAGTLVGLVGVALSHTATSFLVFSFVVGFCSVGAQVLIPFAAHLAPERTRGRVIGNIMAGLLTGIMLSRPIASFITSEFDWRVVFWLSAGVMLVVFALLWRVLPRRRPKPGLHYGQILLSTLRLLATTPALQRRTAYQAIVFATFSLFWTAAPLMLTQSFGYDQQGIALFALAGAAGALAAPIAGRLADRRLVRPGTGLALLCIVLSFLAAGWAAAAGAILALVVATILLDAATQTNQVLGQRVIYSLAAEARGRFNAIYMTVVFLFGAAGSALASVTFFHGGWWVTMLTGAGLGLVALLLFLTEYLGRSKSAAEPQ